MNTTSNFPKKDTSDSEPSQRLRELFVDELKDIYWAEKAIIEAMHKMIKNAISQELVQILTLHLEETKHQVTRLESIFGLIGEKAEVTKCEATSGLIKEAEAMIENTKKGFVRDSEIVSASKKVENYEISTYGILRTFAKILGEDEARALLQTTLDEEKDTESKLTKITESPFKIESIDLS